MAERSAFACAREIEQRLYDILRSAPVASIKQDVCIHYADALAEFQEELDRILVKHGIVPLSGPELEDGAGRRE